MSTGALLAIDLVAVLLLAFGLYFPRYQRRDMVVALLGINIGVMAVATALANAEVSAGVGLGLFGVLSIIRIRSEELTQPRWSSTSLRSPWGSSVAFPSSRPGTPRP